MTDDGGRKTEIIEFGIRNGEWGSDWKVKIGSRKEEKIV
jgi:hypothetical protein